MLSNLKARSMANEKRLNDEVSLACNMIAQRDTQATLQISRAALSDSTAMKTIAIVTMIFLPATFVSAIFGMSFFNFSGGSGSAGRFTVSRDIWIYFAISIPLTLISIYSWYTWHTRAEKSTLKPLKSFKLDGLEHLASV
ncbi:hypothetical protein MBLNU459_g1476t1 [Dothideomycetes sp. NU459]